MGTLLMTKLHKKVPLKVLLCCLYCFDFEIKVLTVSEVQLNYKNHSAFTTSY
jgi:hypothetical protein